MRRSLPAPGLLLAALLLLTGCAARGPATFDVPQGQFPAAFDAARDVLRQARFTLERVDARDGVLTTTLKPSSGLATPWDAEQSSLDAELEDFLNQRARDVRVTFTLPDAPAPPDAPRHDRLAEPSPPMVAEVVVSLWQRQSPHLRSPARAITLTSQALDPQARAQGIGRSFAVPVGRDTRLAARLARAIEQRMAHGSPGVGSGSRSE